MSKLSLVVLIFAVALLPAANAWFHWDDSWRADEANKQPQQDATLVQSSGSKPKGSKPGEDGSKECKLTEKCKSHRECEGSDDLLGPRCVGLSVQKCQCHKCLPFHTLECGSDQQCGGMIGACLKKEKNEDSKCDCYAAVYKHMNLSSAASGKQAPSNQFLAWNTFCITEDVSPDAPCLGVGTGEGTCYCPPKL